MEELSDFYYFRLLYDFIHSEIDDFAIGLLGRTMTLVGAAALSLLTLWILIRGYRIVTGQSRQPMMALVTDSLRSTFVLGLACGMALGGSTIYERLGNDLPDVISQVVTGSDTPVNEQIDRSLALMQLALVRIDALDPGEDLFINRTKTRALWFTGIGTAGPAMAGGAMLLMFQIALALFIRLGPLFVTSLLFEQTKALFGRWLYYGIGTMFSLAVLSVMVTLALDMVLAVGNAFWLGDALTGNTEGITSQAMQQGSLGLILTMLIISVPPMAAAFFNGVLGNFSPFSAFGGGMGRRETSGHDSYAGQASTASDNSQEFHSVQHHLRQVPTTASDADQIKRLPHPHEPNQAALTTEEIERRVLAELTAHDAAASGVLLAGVRGGPVRLPAPGIPVSENRGWDAALNIAADPLGLLEPYYATRGAMAQMDEAMRKQRVDQFRQSMVEAGVKDVPPGYDRAWIEGGRQVNDYDGTLNKLANRYMDHLQDQRLREMWGDNYKDIRLGKSQMNVLEFERWVLDAQQKAVDRAYTIGIEAMKSGEIKPVDGQYARELGNFIDRRAKDTIRAMARDEGINENGPSKVWGINRRLKAEDILGHGIPDNRFGFNLYADTTLARKSADSEQIQRWNTIRPGHTVIIRPTQIGGSYVIPRAQIPDYSPSPYAHKREVMSLRRSWEEFMGSISTATTEPPDGYPDWLPLTWDQHKDDLREMWGRIRPRLKHDLDKAEMLDCQLNAMIAAYDAGNKQLGRKIAWDIYNSKPEKLK